MTQKQFDIFLAAFFSDLEKLKELVVSKDDIALPMEIEDEDLYEGTKAFNFTVLDILQMNIDCFLPFKENKEAVSSRIAHAVFFQNAQKCFEYMLGRFPGITYNGIEYEKYNNLMLSYDEEDNWISESEMTEYEEEGYRKIDLELINYGIKRNAKKVIELLDMGANPMIDPDDKTFDSEILYCLGGDSGIHFSNLVDYHRQKNYVIANYPQLIKELYAAASSEKLFGIINTRAKQSQLLN